MTNTDTFKDIEKLEADLWEAPSDRMDKVLMLDARNIYRKVTRKICDFSPEQLHNLAAIVWLYRGQGERFLGLVKDYLRRVCAESAAIPGALAPFATTLADLRGRFKALAKIVVKHADLDAGKTQALAAAVTELRDAAAIRRSLNLGVSAGLSTESAGPPPNTPMLGERFGEDDRRHATWTPRNGRLVAQSMRSRAARGEGSTRC